MKTQSSRAARSSRATPNGSSQNGRVRYAVVGLGYIAQIAVLPAFRHAKKNSELVALVSGTPEKLDSLKRKYRVPNAMRYDEYDDLLMSGEVDAVYVCLPNDMHRDCVIRTAAAGVHVLCEKPLGLTVAECREMIAATRRNKVKLATAYRLHYDPATLAVIDVVRSGRIGKPRFFTSSFSMQVKDRGNIRLSDDRGGGPLYDLGVYCINASRSIFRDEPVEVTAMHATGDDARFREVEEMHFATLRFPGDRIATFGCSFGAADTSVYDVIGTKGTVRLEPAYEYAEGLEMKVTVDGKSRRRRYAKRDQFGPEIVAFSDCVLTGKEPEPSGLEGLADVRVIEAIVQSSSSGRAVSLRGEVQTRHPVADQAMRRPPVREPELVRAKSPGAS